MIKLQSLETSEDDRLAHCERVIERGFTVFVEVGQALAEIRDAKLYRASHKTFEEYCKARWDIGRSRAYELIDQAKVSTALADAGVNLSGAPDISARDARVLKEDLPAAAEEIKARVDQGAKVEDATKAVAASRQAEKVAQKEEVARRQEEVRAKLSPEVQAQQQAKADAVAAQKLRPPTQAEFDALQEENEELREANAALEADIARLTAENKTYSEMRVQFEQGGFDNVIAGKDEEIRVLQTRLFRESEDKASWMRSAKYWQEEAKKLGFSRNLEIDVETGEVING